MTSAGLHRSATWACHERNLLQTMTTTMRADPAEACLARLTLLFLSDSSLGAARLGQCSAPGSRDEKYSGLASHSGRIASMLSSYICCARDTDIFIR